MLNVIGSQPSPGLDGAIAVASFAPLAERKTNRTFEATSAPQMT
jgi:hypothetical protein